MSMIGNLRRVSDEQLAELFASPDTIEDFLYESDEETPDDLDLEKTWHGLHFLLTGDAWGGDPPLNFLVAGGREIGDVDVGYGPARGFTAAQTGEIASALEPIAPADLRSRFEPQRMMSAEIYPEIWDRDPSEDDTAGWLIEYYEPLKTFLRTARRDGKGLVVYLN